jgi:hypothetical protein
MSQTIDQSLRARRARIASWLDQHTDAALAIGICKRWISDLVDSNQRLHSRHDLPGLPPPFCLITRLSEANLGALSDALAWRIGGSRGVETAEAELVSHALAVASGCAYVAYGPQKLGWIGHLVSTIDSYAWETFADSAAAALREHADRRSEFIEFLRAIIKNANDEPDRVIDMPSRRGSMVSIVEQFVRTGGFQQVWEADRAPVLFGSSDVFEILRRTDPELFLKMIDELPHPTLVKQCLSSKALLENPSVVLTLLGLAGASFDREGRWQRHGMAAILLLQLASAQLLAVTNAPEAQGRYAHFVGQRAALGGLQAVDPAEDLREAIAMFREAANRVLDILFARSDGIELSWHWLENLLRQAPQRPPSADGRQPRDQMINDIGILVQAVSGRLAPHRAHDAWIEEAPRLVQQYRGIAVLSVAAFSATASDMDIGAVARGLLKRSGFQLTRSTELIQQPGAPLRTIPGDALARIPDPATWFKDCWSALRFEREQAWRRAAARGGANPAEILGLWGLGIIESLALDAEWQHPNTRAIWLALEGAFREARLVEPRMPKDFWSHAVARLFWWWPLVFAPAPTPTGNSEYAIGAEPAVLCNILAPYIEISADFMAIAVSLAQAGVGAMQLDRAVRETGHDLMRMIRRFRETARGLKDQRIWNPEWVAALDRIEAAIGANRTANEGITPPS